jgi:hypothetical protein
MSALRIRFTFLDGSGSVTGPVQGAGGIIDSVERLDAAARLSAAGREHGLYEPEPGSVACYPDYSAKGNGEEYVILLSEVRWEDEADYDPTPWCTGCGAMRASQCHCGPIADNN